MSFISFKTLGQNDVTTSRTLLHEAIPITGTLVSGTYNTTQHSDGVQREANVKTFSHGMFQSVYDYPYVSSSANHIFDISYGHHETHTAVPGTTVQPNKKLNVYNQMAQILVGYDLEGNVKRFDRTPTAGEDDNSGIFRACYFFTFSRLLVKDEIKKGSFEMKIGIGESYADPFSTVMTLSDADSAENYRSTSPAGEFGFLKASDGVIYGLIYYQAGIVALRGGSGGFFTSMRALNGTGDPGDEPDLLASGGRQGDTTIAQSNTIDVTADALRHRIQNIKFNNTTELNSTIYFCRANSNDFNYSSNPTYLSGSKIRVKTDPGTFERTNPPMSYVTTVGLYSPDNVLLAVAKLSEPLKKTPTNELTLRVRLDY